MSLMKKTSAELDKPVNTVKKEHDASTEFPESIKSLIRERNRLRRIYRRTLYPGDKVRASHKSTEVRYAIKDYRRDLEELRAADLMKKTPAELDKPVNTVKKEHDASTEFPESIKSLIRERNRLRRIYRRTLYPGDKVRASHKATEVRYAIKDYRRDFEKLREACLLPVENSGQPLTLNPEMEKYFAFLFENLSLQYSNIPNKPSQSSRQ